MSDLARGSTARKRLYWDQISRDWEAAPSALWRSHSDEMNLRLLDRWMPRGRVRRALKTDLFDESVTRGLQSGLEQCSQRWTGIDLSEGVIQAARRKWGLPRVSSADLRNLPFRNESFDLILSNSTLDHFASKDDIVRACLELRRILTPDGVLLLTIDNLANPVIRLRNSLPVSFLRRSHLVPYYVGETLTLPSLVELLESLEFKILDTCSIMHCPRAPAVLLSQIAEFSRSSWIRRAFLWTLRAFEVLERLPSRYRTAYFVGVKATFR